jgi:N utilization substance protein A
MTARVLLGWVDPTELEEEADEDEVEGDDDALEAEADNAQA